MNSIQYYIANPRQLALAIVKRMTWLPDSFFLRLRFYFENGKCLHLSNPRTFQEKIQWLKLHRREPIYTTMVDKLAVKDFVRNLIGDEFVIPTLGVWNSFDDINFDELPNRFVLKTTHGGGNGGVVVCRNKNTFNKKTAKKKLESSLAINIYDTYKEWPYKNVPRKIIAEKFIEMPGKEDLTDFKIFCFNGIPRYIQVIQDRNTHESIDFFDTNWNHQEFFGLNPIARPAGLAVARPAGLDKMLAMASILSRDTEFLRVDLYNTGEQILFGELTFFPASGFGTFTPSEWNKKLGDLIILKH